MLNNDGDYNIVETPKTNWVQMGAFGLSTAFAGLAIGYFVKGKIDQETMNEMEIRTKETITQYEEEIKETRKTEKELAKQMKEMQKEMKKMQKEMDKMNK